MSIAARMLAQLGRAGQLAGVAATALGVTADRPVVGPLYAQVSISDPCDQRCVMCCYHPPSATRPPLAQFGDAAPGTMSLETFRALVDDLRREGTRQVDLVGRGEPLLNPSVVDMVACARAAGMTVTMISNGTRLNAERASAFVSLGLDRFRVSLDAATPETYGRVHVGARPQTYAAVRANIQRLASARPIGAPPHITLSFTIGALNHHELTEMVETAHTVGADAAHFQHVLLLTEDGEAMRLDDGAYARLLSVAIPAASARAATLGLQTNLRTFAASPPSYRVTRDTDEAEVVPCYVGSFFTVVLGNGNVMPCCQTERPVGSLGEERFATVWHGEAYRAFRAAGRRLPAPSPALATCACDRCYFRPHNVSVHNTLHPFARLPVTRPAALLSADHLLRMSRLDRR